MTGLFVFLLVATNVFFWICTAYCLRKIFHQAYIFHRFGGVKGYLFRVASSRPPDVLIGGAENPYMRRWWIIPRNSWFNIYLHHFLRSDDDRAHHDHPWINVSWLLVGEYTEHTIAKGGVNVKTLRKAGERKWRLPSASHRIELTNGPCWTLFITGPRFRSWGFHCPNGWKPWQEFTGYKNGGGRYDIGPGCDD